jgi:ketosteroid isomerase-like protein
MIVAALAIGVLALAAIWYYQRPTPSESDTAANSTSAAFTQSRFELAERNLQAKQYRDAQRYADDVLATAPDHQQARAIRDQAAAQLRQAATDIEDARKMIQAGDVRGAVRALDEARTIDPVAPGLVEVSQLMAERFKSQAQAAEAELQRSRAAAPVQRSVPPPAPSLPPAPSRPVPTAPAPPTLETPREAPQTISPPRPTPPPVAADPPARTEPAESAAVKPGPSPVTATPDRKLPPPADEDAAIRALVATYVRAIESKDLALFRSIKPNLGADEERRIQQGFRAVTSQKVNITITSIDRRGDTASLQLQRQDIIEAGGRRQSPESRQTMTLAKSNGTWIIVEIGR